MINNAFLSVCLSVSLVEMSLRKVSYWLLLWDVFPNFYIGNVLPGTWNLLFVFLGVHEYTQAPIQDFARGCQLPRLKFDNIAKSYKQSELFVAGV